MAKRKRHRIAEMSYLTLLNGRFSSSKFIFRRSRSCPRFRERRHDTFHPVSYMTVIQHLLPSTDVNPYHAKSCNYMLAGDPHPISHPIVTVFYSSLVNIYQFHSMSAANFFRKSVSLYFTLIVPNRPSTSFSFHQSSLIKFTFSSENLEASCAGSVTSWHLNHFFYNLVS